MDKKFGLTVAELIEELNKVEDKNKQVYLYSEIEEGGDFVQRIDAKHEISKDDLEFGVTFPYYHAGCNPVDAYGVLLESICTLVGA